MPRWLFRRLPCFVIFFISIGVIGALALPFILEFFLLPPILEKIPLSTARAHIFRVTPGAASGSLELEHQHLPVLSLARFKLNYSLASLISGKIDSLQIERAVFHLHREGRQWTVAGLKGTAADASPNSALNGFAPPLQVGALILEHCLIVLHDPKAPDIRIGVSGQFTFVFDDTSPGRLPESMSGSLSVDDHISATVNLFAAQRNDQIQLRIGFSDGRWSIPQHVLPEPLRQLDFGTLSADLDMHLDNRSFSPIRYDLNGSLQGFRLTDPRFQISAAGPAEQLSFSASGRPGGHRYTIHSVAIDQPFAARLDISGSAQLTKQKLQTTGTIQAQLAAGDQRESGQLPVSLDYAASWSGSEGFILNTEGALQFLQPLILAETGSTDPAALQADRLGMALHLQSQDGDSRAELDLHSSAPRLTSTDFEINAADLRLQAFWERTAGQTRARVDGSVKDLALAEQQLVAQTVDFSLPLPRSAVSDQEKTETGAVQIDAVKLGGEQLFSLSSDIELQGATYRVQGVITTPITPEATVAFTATAAPLTGSAELFWKMAPARFSSSALAVFDAMLPGLGFEALVEADGTISASASTLSAELRLLVADGVAEIADRNIRIEDINCSIHLPELPRLRSSPSQQCSTGSIDISSLHFDSGDFTFRLEAPPALFIEKSLLQWCGGTLDSGSLRLSKTMPEIETTFFGSRINLGRLLEQFGFKGFEGEGSLNGRLPVTISSSRIQFEDGFLFSTPGAGGIVRFTNTDLLRQGIGGVSQAGTLSYALNALEDFSYNWTKLSFNTIDDELLLALELDGKPRTALPFRFDKNGLIVESDQGPGLQYPIRLDVNFRLPLAELFQVGQSINSIMGNDQ